MENQTDLIGVAEEEETYKPPHISFSELYAWKMCPFCHGLSYVQKIVKPTFDNLFFAFGAAMHSVCEEIVQNTLSPQEKRDLFEEKFMEEIQERELCDEDPQFIFDMTNQGFDLVDHILPALKKKFGTYKVVSVEERFLVPIEGLESDDYHFKGFIDLVIRTTDGKYHIIDHKSTSWGWTAWKKGDALTNYQITLYKHFFCKKHNIDPKNVETYFGLLKRTAKKDKVEIFRVTSGNKKTHNALNLVRQAVYNILNENFIRNRLSCDRRCPAGLDRSQYC